MVSVGVGSGVGSSVGSGVGTSVGSTVGSEVGASVGTTSVVVTSSVLLLELMNQIAPPIPHISKMIIITIISE